MSNEKKFTAQEKPLLNLFEATKIGTWDWSLATGKIIYSKQWAEIYGYGIEETPQTIETWQKVVHPDDLPSVRNDIEAYFKEKTPSFTIEFRAIRKDGKEIWIHDKIVVMEYGADTKPHRIVGITQDISLLKSAEINLHNNQVKLNMITNIASLGTWEWDVAMRHIEYNQEYLNLLGYTSDEISGSMEEWYNMTHPDDLQTTKTQIASYAEKNIGNYESEVRLKHKNGTYIWTRVLCSVIERAKDGKPKRIIGAHLNIDVLKQSHEYLQKDLTEAKKHNTSLESELVTQIKTLVEQDNNLWRVNEIAQMLLTIDEVTSFQEIVYNCLKILGEATKQNRTYIWKSIVGKNGEDCCTQIHEWVRGVEPIQGIAEYENVLYTSLPTFKKYLEAEKCLNSFIKDLSLSERQILGSQGIKTILIVPIRIQGKNWGFMGVDNCETHELFSLFEENMVLMSGVLIASAMEKNANLDVIREAEERNLLTLNAMPLSYSSWTRDIKHIACNDEAVRLLELSSQQEYLDRFSELSPEYQPDGQLSSDMTHEKIMKTFETGYERFEWVYKTLKGDLIPVEVTLVRVKYKDDYIVESYARDLREQKEIEERNLLILNAMPLCSNWWTRDMVNMECNDEAARLFDLSSQQEYLDRFTELSPEYQPDGQLSSAKAYTKVMAAFDTGYACFEWMHQKLNGDPVPTEVTLVRVKYKDDYIVTGYTRDLRETKTMLAEMHKVEADLRVAHEEALMSSKAKTNFLANMSHEIRTPLNAISGLAEIILRASHGRSTAEHAQGIKNACTNLVNIINDILDISKIESGKLEIVNAEYNLSSVINDTINISRVRLGTKPLVFIANIDSKLPSILYGDEIRIKQILLNLLTNAIKFTSTGHIHLQISGTFNQNKAILQFSITDTGSGIKKDDLERLFAEFERVNTTKNRSIEGTGLGLAISKRLAEMMEGKISVESTFGEGSTFSITIPQTYSNYVPVAKIETKKNILLYEPRDLYAHSIKETILNLGSECQICINQSELYECISRKEYDFIFTTNFNAKKVKQLLKSEKSTAKIVILANFGEKDLETDLYTLFLPVTCLPIADILHNDFDSSYYGSDKTMSIQFVATEAKVLIVDDNSVNLKVAEGLMEPYQFQIDTAMNGLEAIEKIKTKKYDLVFMDHMMPEMDGIDATIAIRAMDDEYYKNLPIIALTANAIVGSKEMFINEGMNDFLAKPIEITKLNNIISKWIPQDKKKEIKKKSKEASSNYSIYVEGMDTASGIASVGGNTENYLQILSIYYNEGLKKCPLLLKLATAKDIQGLKIEVHALKSSSATIGASNISSMARSLEDAAASNNVAYIKEYIDTFITTLKNLLENIKQSLDKYEEEKSITSKEKGTKEYLQSQLQKLTDAIEFINISDIENILEATTNFEWSPEIMSELHKIHDAIVYFDYDKALLCVKSLQEKK